MLVELMRADGVWARHERHHSQKAET
jgi:hypothetical protein